MCIFWHHEASCLRFGGINRYNKSTCIACIFHLIWLASQLRVNWLGASEVFIVFCGRGLSHYNLWLCWLTNKCVSHISDRLSLLNATLNKVLEYLVLNMSSNHWVFFSIQPVHLDHLISICFLLTHGISLGTIWFKTFWDSFCSR